MPKSAMRETSADFNKSQTTAGTRSVSVGDVADFLRVPQPWQLMVSVLGSCKCKVSPANSQFSGTGPQLCRIWALG